MKFIHLIGSRLFQYWRSNKLLFFVYIVCSILCGTGMLYLYGNFTITMQQRGEQITEMKQFRLHFAEDIKPTLTEIQTIAEKLEVPIHSCHIQAVDQTINQMVETVIVGQIPALRVSGEFDLGGRDNENIVIIPNVIPGQHNELDLEKGLLTLKGQELQVVGKFSGMEYLIPLGTYQRLGYPIESAIFTLREKPDDKMEQTILTRLQEQFPTAEIYYPKLYDDFAGRQLPMELFMICLVYGISLFSFLYLMKYMMDQHIAENVVYSLVGAPKKTVIRLVALENLILSTLTSLLSVGLHLLLKESVLDKVSVSANITYRFTDYLLIFILMVVVSQLVSLPFILRYRKQTVAAIKSVELS